MLVRGRLTEGIHAGLSNTVGVEDLLTTSISDFARRVTVISADDALEPGHELIELVDRERLLPIGVHFADLRLFCLRTWPTQANARRDH